MIKNIVLYSLILVCASCVTPKRCLEKFGGTQQVVTVHDTVSVPVVVTVPADSLEGYISKDSLSQLLAGVIDSLINVSADKKVEVGFSRDKKTGGLSYKAKCKADTVRITKEVPIEVKANCPPVVVVDPDKAHRWYGKAWEGFKTFSAFVVLVGITLFFIAILFKLFKPF